MNKQKNNLYNSEKNLQNDVDIEKKKLGKNIKEISLKFKSDKINLPSKFEDSNTLIDIDNDKKNVVNEKKSSINIKNNEVENCNNKYKIPNILLSKTDNTNNKTSNHSINLISLGASLNNIDLSLKGLPKQEKEISSDNNAKSKIIKTRLNFREEADENNMNIISNKSNSSINNSTNKIYFNLSKKSENTSNFITNNINPNNKNTIQSSTLSKIKSQSVILDKYKEKFLINNESKSISQISYSINSRVNHNTSLENINNKKYQNNHANINELTNVKNKNMINKILNNNKLIFNGKSQLLNTQSSNISKSDISVVLLDKKKEIKESNGSLTVQINPDNTKTTNLPSKDNGKRSFSARNLNCLESHSKRAHLVPTVKTKLYEDENKNSNENTIFNTDHSERYKQKHIKTLSEARINKFNQSSSSEDISIKSPSTNNNLIETFVNKLKIIKKNYTSNLNQEEDSILPEINVKDQVKEDYFEIIYDVKEEYY